MKHTKKLLKKKKKKIDEEINNKRKGLKTISKKIKEYKDELITLKNELNWQNHGLYEPKYDFIESESYKERPDNVQYEQKQMIKDKTAAICNVEWKIDEDRRAGIAATNLYFEQTFRSFDNETEVIINKVQPSNLEALLKRLQRSYNQLNKTYLNEVYSDNFSEYINNNEYPRETFYMDFDEVYIEPNYHIDGYVYIISNLGAFGKDIYKIGMTQRKDPSDRFRELSDTSVPFKFDVHILIESYDARRLESELHYLYDNKRVNKSNTRKEFFKLTENDLRDIYYRYQEDIVFYNEYQYAKEYRESLRM